MPMANQLLDLAQGLGKWAWRSTLVAVAAALPLAFVLAGVGQAEPLGESFKDDFTSFDAARWYVSDGWSNGDHQNCLWSSAAVSHLPGRTVLSFIKAPTETHDYRCGEIQTKQRFGYGTFEARLRTDDGSGLNAAFFTYIGPTHGARHDEIDFEILTANVDQVTVNTYVDGQSINGGVYRLRKPANVAFTVYSFIWEPDLLRWFVDGEMIQSVAGPVLPETPQKIYLSLWGTELLNDWMGPFVPPVREKRMEIDWVAFTAQGAPCQFAASVLCKLAGG